MQTQDDHVGNQTGFIFWRFSAAPHTLAGVSENGFGNGNTVATWNDKKKAPASVSPSPVWLIFLEPDGPASRGIWQRTSDNPEESWHWERQSLLCLRPDWKMFSTQRADETNQRSQKGCSCRAGFQMSVRDTVSSHCHREAISHTSATWLQLNELLVRAIVWFCFVSFCFWFICFRYLIMIWLMSC